MIFIIGGYAQGRLAYALQQYSLSAQDICDIAVTDDWQHHKIIYHAEELVTKHICLSDKILLQWQNKIIISQQVGCGLVPISAEERQWRESVGAMNQRIASYADTVIHVCCGLGMYLKQGRSG